MCTFYYLHHHHVPPCPRSIDVVVHYAFCAAAPAADPATGQRAPCGRAARATYHPGRQGVVDHADPCAAGGCLASPDCSSGACRLAQLGGRWVCCRCGGAGNAYRWCCHRMRDSPDTFCYHVCCWGCVADEGGQGGQ